VRADDPPQFDFEASAEGWVCPQGGSSVMVTQDASLVKSGQGALEWSYNAAGEDSTLQRPGPDLKAGANCVSFWIRASDSTNIQFQLFEGDNNAYMLMMHLPALQWRHYEVALTDLIGGQLDVVCEPLSTSAPNAKAGRLRILAGTGTQRSSLAPELETVGEAGVKGMVFSAWVGFFAPAGVPRDISARLCREMMAILRDPAVQDKMRSISWEPRPGDAEALAELLRAEMKAIAATVKAAGIKAE